MCTVTTAICEGLAFNRSVTTQAVVLGISKAFGRIWHAALFHKSKPFRSNIWPYFVFLRNRWLQVVHDGKSLQEYPLNAGVSQSSILGPTFFLEYVNDLPDDFIRNIPISADDTTIYSNCDQASDLWQQLEMAAKFKFDQQDTMY